MMIVTKFLHSCCGQATVDGNSLRAGRPFPASMAGGVGARPDHDAGGIESRAHQSPAGCASRSFRIFLLRGFYLERDGGVRVLLSTPAGKYLQPRECFEKRGSPEPRSRDPFRRRGSFLIPAVSS
jgi:hypothetical protein